MPRVRRRPKEHRQVGFTDDHVHHLLTGYCFGGGGFGDDDRGDRPLDLDDLRQAWESLRDELLSAWIAEHPGTRPYAWWVFDAPERRERIDGGLHPFLNGERNARIERFGISDRVAYKLWFGKPSVWMVRDDFDAVYESEADYLDRLFLLTADERAALIEYNADFASRAESGVETIREAMGDL